jgi:hypothetical protein
MATAEAHAAATEMATAEAHAATAKSAAEMSTARRRTMAPERERAAEEAHHDNGCRCSSHHGILPSIPRLCASPAAEAGQA